MKKNTIITGFSLATALALSVSAANAGIIKPLGGNGFAVELGGDACIAANCADLATAGYNVTGGATLNNSIKNVAKKPGEDTRPNDLAVSSFNVTSSKDTPEGAFSDIRVSNLDSRFGFYWGSIDEYNVVKFFNDELLVNTFTGADLAIMLGTSSSPNYNTDQYVTFFVEGPVRPRAQVGGGLGDSGGGDPRFNNVTLSSSGVAFEVAAAVPVPEPGTLGLLGAGLLGLVAARRRRT